MLALVNSGAVQLEPVSVNGLSQLSANRFPAASSIAALPNNPKLKPPVYRYSGGDYELEVLADNTLPFLLYTSPSPRDATLSRMPSSA